MAVVIGVFCIPILGQAGGRRIAGPPQVEADVPATAVDQEVGRANNSPQLVLDPTDSRFVVLANRLDAPDYGCALQVSGDGGRGWVPAAPVPVLPPGADKCYAPEVAFDDNGVLYYLFVGLAGPGNRPMGAFLTTSLDRAQSFTPPRRVLGPLEFSVRMAVARGSGRIHLVWLHAGAEPVFGGFAPTSNPIMAAYSDDGGRTFAPPVQVSDPARERVVAPALALGDDDAVHVAYYDLGRDARDYQGLEGPPWDGTWSVVLTTSTDGGRHFGRGVEVDTEVVTSKRVMLVFTMPPPSLVAAPGGLLCAAWTDARFGDDDAVVRCSPDGGRRWRALGRLNDDAAGNGRSQYLPRLAVAPGGRLDAVFLDRRGDSRNSRHHVFYTSSTDGGTHFAPNRRLTRVSSNPQVGQRYAGVAAEGLVEQGSRLGLLSLRDRAVAGWVDTRNSQMGVPTTQDLYTTVVRLPASSKGGRGVATGLGLGFGAVGALVGARAVRRRSRRRRAQPAT